MSLSLISYFSISQLFLIKKKLTNILKLQIQIMILEK